MRNEDGRCAPGVINFIDIQLAGDIISIGCYDSNGNLTSKTDTSETIGMSYDHLNMMSQFTNSSDSARTGVYSNSDTGLARLQKTIDPNGTPVTRKYVFDGEDVIGYYDGDTAKKEFLTPFLDENLTMEINGDTSGSETDSIYFYFHDGLGSVVNVVRFKKVDSSWSWDKGKSNRYVYYAFGVKRGGKYDTDGDGLASDESLKHWDSREPVDLYETWEPVNQDFEYTGRRFDDESETQESRARQLDLLTGRWLQMDPIGIKAGESYYLYIVNNPTMFTDVLGLEETTEQRVLREAEQPFKDWFDEFSKNMSDEEKKKWKERLKSNWVIYTGIRKIFVNKNKVTFNETVFLDIEDRDTQGKHKLIALSGGKLKHVIDIDINNIDDLAKGAKHRTKCKNALIISTIVHEMTHALDHESGIFDVYDEPSFKAREAEIKRIYKGATSWFSVYTESNAFLTEIFEGMDTRIYFCCPEVIKKFFDIGDKLFNELKKHEPPEKKYYNSLNKKFYKDPITDVYKRYKDLRIKSKEANK